MTQSLGAAMSLEEDGDFTNVSASETKESRSHRHYGRLLLTTPSPSSEEDCDIEWEDNEKGENKTYALLKKKCDKKNKVNKNVTCFIKDSKQCMPCSLTGYAAFVSLAMFAIVGYTGLLFYNTILEAAESGKKGYSSVVKYVEVLLKFVQIIGVGSVSILFGLVWC